MKKAVGIGVVAALGALVVSATSVAGSGSPGPAAQKSAPVVVTMKDNFFTPVKAVVTAGGKVTWRNGGKAKHNAVANSGAFNTGNFGPGQTRTVKFKKAGKFPYVCTIHSGMRGKVKVRPAG
jgi:plastocyanin